ncbi:MAG: glycosyltransferase family 4 protein [Parasphingorhabdus sp.]|uniref:glycosyltransferase family 4 protein n=1 Tax=Parasphingorhabdus sp. TaxID=2709688 RepID=UPI003001D9A7
MKLLFALPGFHNYDRGAEVALMSVAEELAATGDDVTLMGSGQPRPGTSYHFEHIDARAREGFEKWPNFPPLRSETAWEDASFSVNLLRRYNPSEFDAVVTCSFPFTHWALRRPARRKPLQIFVTQNGDWPAYENRSEYRTFSCDGLVCSNPDYYERNRKKWNCALIPNGVDLSRFKPGQGDRARFGFPSDKRIILMVSAFIESKRVLEGIRAVSKMEDAYLVVAGDGPLRNEAQALADGLMPGRFQRISLTAGEMPLLYQSVDTFLHLSLLESFGNVFLEAWASGLPIIAHDTERLRWILGEYGYLCDTEDQPMLIRTLVDALSSGCTDNSVGIDRFAWSTIAGEYRSFISGLKKIASSVP